MKTFEELRSDVNRAIDGLSDLKGNPVQLYEPISYTLELGGKRLRPVMALMACQLFGEDPQRAMMPAVGLEIFHNFTLLHDDVMDRADMRRGRPTVHAKWNANVAILSGDAMFALASSLIAQAPAESLSSVLNTFNGLALGVCEGQQYDMNFETQAKVEMAEYMEMIRLKTAVLLAGALQIGALVAGAPGPAVQHLHAFGTRIGLAFQLQDDLLDLYADEAKFGKKIGSDIRENKKTFLYIKALELLDWDDRTRLEETFRTPTTPGNEAAKIDFVRALYEKVSVRSCVEEEITRLFGEGEAELARLSKADVDSEALEVLQDFSAGLLGREY